MSEVEKSRRDILRTIERQQEELMLQTDSALQNARLWEQEPILSHSEEYQTVIKVRIRHGVARIDMKCSGHNEPSCWFVPSDLLPPGFMGPKAGTHY